MSCVDAVTLRCSYRELWPIILSVQVCRMNTSSRVVLLRLRLRPAALVARLPVPPPNLVSDRRWSARHTVFHDLVGLWSCCCLLSDPEIEASRRFSPIDFDCPHVICSKWPQLPLYAVLIIDVEERRTVFGREYFNKATKSPKSTVSLLGGSVKQLEIGRKFTKIPSGLNYHYTLS
ncbi:hypothetical protein J6590_014095 [Homalodisca vitripennis]|nr:hypothetical protein J6590_014095 [Homalodisca vitripennis]